MERGEGLVLKPDSPYFDFGSAKRPFSGCSIKLKKEYIGQFGDVGDFAVVGARYEAAKAKAYGIPGLRWTHFFVGCLDNKEAVRRWGKRPRFVVTNVVELNVAQMRTFVTSCNPDTIPAKENYEFDVRVAKGVDNGRLPHDIFVKPPVFDMRCFSFHKQGNTGFWSLRFPIVGKIHFDRSYLDAMTFGELQELAEEEKDTSPPEDSQELKGWIAALERADPGGVPVDAASQSTVSTDPASPPKGLSSTRRLCHPSPTSLYQAQWSRPHQTLFRLPRCRLPDPRLTITPRCQA